MDVNDSISFKYSINLMIELVLSIAWMLMIILVYSMGVNDSISFKYSMGVMIALVLSIAWVLMIALVLGIASI